MPIDLTADSSDEEAGLGLQGGSKRTNRNLGHLATGNLSSKARGRGEHSKQGTSALRPSQQQSPKFSKPSAGPSLATEEDLLAYLASRCGAAAPEKTAAAAALGGGKPDDPEEEGHDGPPQNLKKRKTAAAASAAASRRAPLSEVQPRTAAAAAGSMGGRGSPSKRSRCDSGEQEAANQNWDKFVERLVSEKAAEVNILGGAELASDSSDEDEDESAPGGPSKPTAAGGSGRGSGCGQPVAGQGSGRGGGSRGRPPPAKVQRDAACAAAGDAGKTPPPAVRGSERGGFMLGSQPSVSSPGPAGLWGFDDSGAPRDEDCEEEEEDEEEDGFAPLGPPRGTSSRGRAGSGGGGAAQAAAAAAASGRPRARLEEEDPGFDPKATRHDGCSDEDDDYEILKGRGGSRGRAAGGSVGGSRRGKGGSSGAAAATAGAAPAKRWSRKTEEEKAAEAEAKRRKKEEQQRAKEEKAAAIIMEKLVKEHQKMSDRQASGRIFEREIVICMPSDLASSALGQAISNALQLKRWGMWRISDPGEYQQLAAAIEETRASSGAGGGGRGRGRGDGGCAVVTFQRRKLEPADIKSVPESQQLTGPFETSARVPCILLIFHQPAAFVEQLQSPNGGFHALLRRVAALHPDCSLQVLVIGLDSYLKAQERRDFQNGTAAFVASNLQEAVLRLQLSRPALQLRKVPNPDVAVQHVLHLTRTLGEQPYKRTERDDALGAAKNGESFEVAAAGGMQEDLGPGARKVARCLGRVQGLGGGQVWAICRQFASLGAMTQGFVREQQAGRDPAALISELRDTRGKQRRLGGALGARLALLLTTTDPDALVGAGDDGVA